MSFFLSLYCLDGTLYAHLEHGLQLHAGETHSDGLRQQRLQISDGKSNDSITHHESALMNGIVDNLRFDLPSVNALCGSQR